MTTAATASGSIGQHRGRRRGILTALIACGLALTLPAPATAMQLLEAVDHAELSAEVSSTEVNRIALLGDRAVRVVRAPDGFAVEHDAASGDLWLRRHGAVSPDGKPVTLFLGTEKGFTYRLTLTASDREAAQILIRNAEALPGAPTDAADTAGPKNARIAALVRLVRAVARREAAPGYGIHAGGGSPAAGLTLIETWRGPRFRAFVLEADPLPSAGTPDAAGLAGTMAGLGRVAALWLAEPGSGPRGGRLTVAVMDTADTGEPR